MTQFIYLTLSIVFTITACSVAFSKKSERKPDSLQWRQHQQNILRLKQYQTQGTLAFFSHQKKFCSRFFLEKTQLGNYYLLLFDPSGSMRILLSIRSGQLEIMENNSRFYTRNDAQKIIKKFTGITIPFGKLYQWILGLPSNATNYKLDNYHRLRELNYNQNGKIWRVIYGGYYEDNTPAMPSFIDLTTDTQHIKFKIDHWITK